MLKPEKIIIYISIALFTLSVYLYSKEIKNLEQEEEKANRNFIGVVVDSTGDTKIRFGDSISWKKLAQKSRIYTGAYLYTGKDSSIKVALLDHSSINLEENALIFIDSLPNIQKVQRLKEQRLDPLQLKYYGGVALIETTENSAIKKIETKTEKIELNKKKTNLKIEEVESETKKEKTRSISVISGNVSLTRSAGGAGGGSKKKSLGAGQKSSGEQILASEVAEDIDREMKRVDEEEEKRRKVFEDFKDRHSFAVFYKRLKSFINVLLFEQNDQTPKEDTSKENF